jgi:hypothetical protein
MGVVSKRDGTSNPAHIRNVRGTGPVADGAGQRSGLGRSLGTEQVQNGGVGTMGGEEGGGCLRVGVSERMGRVGG